MDILIGVILVILGFIIGSFLNVVIYRYPLGESIIFPNSFCPKCEEELKWYHNIPVLSYIFLKGKCAFCKERISLRYPLVEALTGASFLLVYLSVGFDYLLIFYLIFVIFGILITFIDIDHKIIPDLFLLILLINGVAYFTYNVLSVSDYNYMSHIIGLFVGFLPFYLIRLFASLIYKKEAMGFGDVKYMGVIGFFLGWEKVLLVILIGSFLGSVIEVTLMLLKKKSRDAEFAFGPYLVMASFIALLYGNIIIEFYLKLLGLGG